MKSYHKQYGNGKRECRHGAIVHVSRAFNSIAAWWQSGPSASRWWVLYFYYHVALTVWLGVAALLDASRCDLDWATDVPAWLWFIEFGVTSVVGLQATFLPILAPFLSIRMLWCARRGGPVFFTFAVCDMMTTICQYLALLILCS